MRNPDLRPLSGSALCLSISESEDSAHLGFPSWQVNRVTLQVVSTLFGQGVAVLFGHDWRENGVMETVHGFARQMQSIDPTENADAGGQALLRNLLPWPDQPSLSAEDRERLAQTVQIEQAGLPHELAGHGSVEAAADRASPRFQYLRARGLTHLRRLLTERSQGRLCLGGRIRGSEGRWPGIIEEAFLSVEARKPLYLASCLGGATRQVIDALEGGEMPETFCADAPISALYRDPPFAKHRAGARTDREIDRDGLWQSFRRTRTEGLAEVNGLSVSENAELFHTAVLDRVIELVLLGLGRIQGREGSGEE